MLGFGGVGIGVAGAQGAPQHALRARTVVDWMRLGEDQQRMTCSSAAAASIFFAFTSPANADLPE